MQHITLWDGKYPQTSSSSKKQHPCLTYSPPKVLDERQTAQTCRNFYYSKDELCEVDIQTKIANIQAQSIVHQTCSKPVKWEEYLQRYTKDIGLDVTEGCG